jgi:hypothetical protein
VKTPTIDLNNHLVNMTPPLCNTLSLKTHSGQSLQCFLKKSSLHGAKQNSQRKVHDIEHRSPYVLFRGVLGKQISETQRFVIEENSLNNTHLQNTHFKSVWNDSNCAVSSYSPQRHLSTPSLNHSGENLDPSNYCLFPTSLTTLSRIQRYKTNAPTVPSSIRQHLHPDEEQSESILSQIYKTPLPLARSKDVICASNKGIHYKEGTEETRHNLVRGKSNSFSSFDSQIWNAMLLNNNNNNNTNLNDSLINEKLTNSLTKYSIPLYPNVIHGSTFNNYTIPFKLLHPLLWNSRFNGTKGVEQRDAMESKEKIGYQSLDCLNSSELVCKRPLKKKSFTQYLSRQNYDIRSLVCPRRASYPSKVQPVSNLLCTFSSPSVPSIHSYASLLPYRNSNTDEYAYDKYLKDIFLNSSSCPPTNSFMSLSSSLLASSFKTSVLTANSSKNKSLKILKSPLLQRKFMAYSDTYEKKDKFGNKKQFQTNSLRNVLKQKENDQYPFSKNSSIVSRFKHGPVPSTLTKRVDSQFFRHCKHKHSIKPTQQSSPELSLYLSKTQGVNCNASGSECTSQISLMDNLLNQNENFDTRLSEDLQLSKLTKKTVSSDDLLYQNVKRNKKHLRSSLTRSCQSEPTLPDCHATNSFIKPISPFHTAKQMSQLIKNGSSKTASHSSEDYRSTGSQVFTEVSHHQKRFNMPSNYKNVFSTRLMSRNILKKNSLQNLSEYQNETLRDKSPNRSTTLTFSRSTTVSFLPKKKQDLFLSKMISQKNLKSQSFPGAFDHKGTPNAKSKNSLIPFSQHTCSSEQLKCLNQRLLSKLLKSNTKEIEKQRILEQCVRNLCNSSQYSTIALSCPEKLSLFPKQTVYLKWNPYENEVFSTMLKLNKNCEPMVAYSFKYKRKKKKLKKDSSIFMQHAPFKQAVTRKIILSSLSSFNERNSERVKRQLSIKTANRQRVPKSWNNLPGFQKYKANACCVEIPNVFDTSLVKIPQNSMVNVSNLPYPHQRELIFFPLKKVSLNFYPLATQSCKEIFQLNTPKTSDLFSFFPQSALCQFPTKLTPIKVFSDRNPPQNLPRILLKEVMNPANTSFSNNKILVPYKKKTSATLENRTLSKTEIKHVDYKYFKKAIQSDTISTKKQLRNVISISPPVIKTITRHALNFESPNVKRIPSSLDDVIFPNKTVVQTSNFSNDNRNQLTGCVTKRAKVGESNDKGKSV